MKKVLFVAIYLLFSTFASAAVECAYSPLQSRIVTARTRADIQELIDRGISIEGGAKCGGSLLQLAVRRGVPGVLTAILEQDPARANSMEQLDAFPIPGVTGPIPIILFAAYYAPNKEMVQALLDVGADVTATDSNGRNVLWFMQFNPVLKNTNLYDSINDKILDSLKKQPPTTASKAIRMKKSGDTLLMKED